MFNSRDLDNVQWVCSDCTVLNRLADMDCQTCRRRQPDFGAAPELELDRRQTLYFSEGDLAIYIQRHSGGGLPRGNRKRRSEESLYRGVGDEQKSTSFCKRKVAFVGVSGVASGFFAHAGGMSAVAFAGVTIPNWMIGAAVGCLAACLLLVVWACCCGNRNRNDEQPLLQDNRHVTTTPYRSFQ